MSKYSLGIDVGSTTVKPVITDADGNIIYSKYIINPPSPIKNMECKFIIYTPYYTMSYLIFIMYLYTRHS